MDRAEAIITVKKDKETKQGHFRYTCSISAFSDLPFIHIIVEVKERCRRAFGLNDGDFIRLYCEDQELRNNERTIMEYGIHKLKEPTFILKITEPDETPIAFTMLSALSVCQSAFRSNRG